jgi:hypothetical protein
MSFQTVSLLMNYLEIGVLLAILFRLGRTFELIANTQRQLRRTIYHLGEHRPNEPGLANALDGANITAASGSARTPAEA